MEKTTMNEENNDRIVKGLLHISEQIKEFKQPAHEWKFTSEQTDKLDAALVKVQGSLPQLTPDSKGYGFKYASLPLLVDLIKPYFFENDLRLEQALFYENNQLFLITSIKHASGQWTRDKGPIFAPKRSEVPSNKDYNQAVGTTITYMRRYALECMLGIKADKDDLDQK